MGFSRQEKWSGLPFPPLGDLPDPGIEPVPPVSPILQADSLPLSHQGSPYIYIYYYIICSVFVCVLCLVTLSCPALCDPMDCSPPGSSVHGDSPGKNTGAGCHVLLQGVFPTQGSNPGLPHCRWILYQEVQDL